MKLKIQLNIITLLISLIAMVILIIIGTVTVYIKYSHISLLGDIDSKLFGEFGEFIGGVGGTLFSLVAILLLWLTYKEQQKELKETKALTRTQINLSLKPDLFTIDSEFKGFSELDKNGSSFAMFFTTENKYTEESPGPKVQIVNVGVAVAKHITYEWEYDLKQTINYIRDNYDTSEFDLEENESRNQAKIGIKGQAAIYINYRAISERFDVLLPYKSDENIKRIPFPHAYLTCYSIAYQLFLSKESKLNDSLFIFNFPKCYLKMTYSDIADNIHKKRLSFRVDFGHVYKRVSRDLENMFDGLIIGFEDK
jgi:hypothetical protein